MNNFIKNLVKLTVSITILVCVLCNINLDYVVKTIYTANIWLLIFAAVFVFIPLLMMVLKWRIFIYNIKKLPITNLFSMYWASDFIGLLNIGSVGSELYKMFLFEDKKGALAASLADKFYTFLWYIIMLLSCLTVLLLTNRFYFIEVAVSIMLYCFFVLVFIKIDYKIKKTLRMKNINKLKQLSRIVDISSKELFMHALYSAIYIVALFIVYSIVLYSAKIPFTLLLFVPLPLIAILVTLPISFQGLGVREVVLINYAMLMGIEQTVIIGASFLIFLIFVVFRLFGIIPFLFLNMHVKK
jgi:glycosyltransferase 2 family protein